MPDVKPRPRAGAIRLSLMRADQKGTGSASVLVSVACIPGPRIDSRLAPEAYSRPIQPVLPAGSCLLRPESDPRLAVAPRKARRPTGAPLPKFVKRRGTPDTNFGSKGAPASLWFLVPLFDLK